MSKDFIEEVKHFFYTFGLFLVSHENVNCFIPRIEELNDFYEKNNYFVLKSSVIID